MKHRVYYDAGDGQASLITAAIHLKMLPRNVQPDPYVLAQFIREHGRVRYPGQVHFLGEYRGERVYWCGLGKRSSGIVVRAWRHFLAHYQQEQTDYRFYFVPHPRHFQWKWGERLFVKRGRWQEHGSLWMARAAIREYAVFLTILLTDLSGGSH